MSYTLFLREGSELRRGGRIGGYAKNTAYRFGIGGAGLVSPVLTRGTSDLNQTANQTPAAIT